MDPEYVPRNGPDCGTITMFRGGYGEYRMTISEEDVDIRSGTIIELCFLCGSSGRCLYTNLAERGFSSNKKWSFYLCSNSNCGLVWLCPQPSPEDFDSLYRDSYYTHVVPKPKLLGKIIGHIEKNRRLWRFPGSSISPSERSRGRLLDVGCGRGGYLKRMQDLGWEVEGVEPDAEAVRIASGQLGLKVHHGTIETVDLPDGSIDVISLNHVLEHVADPLDLLQSCYRILEKNGSIVIRTPNTASLGHRIFRSSWYPLEVPRHFFLFSRDNISSLVEKAGFRISRIQTTFQGARLFFSSSCFYPASAYASGSSKPLRREGGSTLGILGICYVKLLRFVGLFYLLCELIFLKKYKNIGEELVLFCVKDESEEHGRPLPYC